MHRNETFRNEQSQLSTLRGRHGRRNFGEFVEHPVELIRRNAASRVLYTGLDHAVGKSLEPDRDVSSGRCEFNRIADEIPENLLQFVAIPLNHGQMCRLVDVDGDLFFGGHRAQALDDQHGNLIDAQRFQTEDLLLHVHSRPVQQLVDDSGQAIQVVFDPGEIRFLAVCQGTGNAVEHVVGKTADSRHRRAQFMRGHRDEHGAPAVMLLETFVCNRQLLRAFLYAVLQMLRQLGEIGIGPCVVDRRGDMAGDREQDAEILLGTRLLTSICRNKAQRLVVSLQRDTDKRLQPHAAG